MCMKYINTNVQCFSASNKGLLENIAFSSILESVKSEQKEDKFVVGGFNIVTFINIRGTKSGENENNPLDTGKKLNFKIRLTKLSKNSDEQMSYDLKDFDIDLSDKNNNRMACFGYTERIEITKVDDLVLNDIGEYVIKVLVKYDKEELYDVQMLHPLTIK